MPAAARSPADGGADAASPPGTGSDGGGVSGSLAPAGRKLSLASATAAELDELPGVGPVTAQKIIDYRAEHGLGGRRVVMYAGNVGLSQSLDLVLDAARRFATSRPDVVFVINGGGAARPDLERRAEGLARLATSRMVCRRLSVKWVWAKKTAGSRYSRRAAPASWPERRCSPRRQARRRGPMCRSARRRFTAWVSAPVLQG